MSGNLSPIELDALFAINKKRHGSAAEIGATGNVLSVLHRKGLVIADHGGRPSLYRISEAGNQLAEELSRIAPVDREPPIARIQRIVAAHYGIPPMEMVSARRSLRVARPRQVAMYLAKRTTPKSLPEIGRRFGNRDHTTVIHAIQKVESLIPVDRSIRDSVAELLSSLSVPPQSIHSSDAFVPVGERQLEAA